jgi:hypothetical protein
MQGTLLFIAINLTYKTIIWYSTKMCPKICPSIFQLFPQLFMVGYVLFSNLFRVRYICLEIK